MLPRVDIIMAYENMDGALIDAAVAAGAKGIVIAGVGNGNMTEGGARGARGAGEEGDRRACARRGSRRARWAGTSRWTTTRYGFVASLGLNPQKSRVLLRLALLKTQDPKTIQRYFDEY